MRTNTNTGNDVHVPRPHRCDYCRKQKAGSSSAALLSRPNANGKHRQRRQRAIFAIIASAALSSMGSVKSGGTPLAVVAAAPIHHSSIRCGNFVGSIATLFLSTEAVRAGSILHPPLADATLVSAVVVPPTLVVEKGAHGEVTNGVDNLAHEGEIGFNSNRFLQSVEADSDIDHEDHEIDIDANNIIQENQQEVENLLPWGPVIGATFLVTLATFSGLLIIAAESVYLKILKRQGRKTNNGQSDPLDDPKASFHMCVFAFAAGALTSTAVFLVLPEALHLVGGKHEAEEGAHRYLEGEEFVDENVAAAKFGCAVMGGFLLPMLFGIVFHRPKVIEDDKSVDSKGDAESCIEQNAEVKTGVLVTIELTESKLGADSVTELISASENNPYILPDRNEVCDICDEPHYAAIAPIQESVRSVENIFINKHLCASILLGDAFHNFSDGIFIAASFKASCDVSTSVSIVMVTIIHEMAQEMADFILLTRHVGLSAPKALLLNFLSGLSVVLGGIMFLVGNPSDEATGILLGMGGGVYLNMAACETLPRIESIIRTRVDRICTLFFFIIGTIPVGLVLLNHRHCG